MDPYTSIRSSEMTAVSSHFCSKQANEKGVRLLLVKVLMGIANNFKIA